MKVRVFLFVVLFSALLVGCGDREAEVEGEGVEGRVWVEPSCPQGEICLEEPFEANLTVIGPGGVAIARSESGKDGFFRIPLPPGEYVLVPEYPNEDGIPAAQPIPIEVKAGSWVQVTVIYRTDIR
jgi:hypothetical protein